MPKRSRRRSNSPRDKVENDRGRRGHRVTAKASQRSLPKLEHRPSRTRASALLSIFNLAPTIGPVLLTVRNMSRCR